MTRSWPVGKCVRFAVRLQGVAETMLGALAGSESAPRQRADFQLTGTLAIVTLRPDQLVLWWERPHITLRQSGSAVSTQALAVALGKPVTVELSAGTVRRIGFSEALDDTAQQTWRSVLTLLQWAPADTPSAVEPELLGEVTVRYRRAGATLERTVLSIRRNDDVVVVPKGSTRVHFDSAGLVRLEAALTQTMTLGGRTLGTSTLKASLTRQSCTASPRLPKCLPTPTVPLSTALSAEQTATAIHTSALKGATATSLLKELRAPSLAEENPLYLSLRALLSLQPEATGVFSPWLKSASVTLPGVRLLCATLGEVGTPAAQQTLRDAIQTRRQDTAFLEHALPALALTPRPNTETERLFWALSARDDIVGHSAILLLGTLAHGLQKTAPERSVALVARLSEHLRRAIGPSETHRWLGSLGNAGAPETEALLRSFLSAPDPRTRAEAIEALRLLPGTAIDQLIAQFQQTDPDPQVRERARFVEQQRHRQKLR